VLVSNCRAAIHGNTFGKNYDVPFFAASQSKGSGVLFFSSFHKHNYTRKHTRLQFFLLFVLSALPQATLNEYFNTHSSGLM
jgi:hypothetical protein